MTLFPVIRDWIAQFLLDIRDMTASEIGRNMLIEQVMMLSSQLLLLVVCGDFRASWRNGAASRRALRVKALSHRIRYRTASYGTASGVKVPLVCSV